MLIEERLNKIVEIIRINDSARIEELAETLGVSRDTVCRDLIRLENEGVIKRTHGGAVLNDNRASIVFYDERKNQKLESKKAMGRCAAKLIKKDASVIFDASTTVEEVISFLDKKHIFAVTNSLTAATELTQLNDCTIAVLPGRLDHNHLYVTGSDTVQKLNQYNVDYLLLSVYAMDSGGIYTCSESEGAVKAKMLASALLIKSYLLKEGDQPEGSPGS